VETAVTFGKFHCRPPSCDLFHFSLKFSRRDRGGEARIFAIFRILIIAKTAVAKHLVFSHIWRLHTVSFREVGEHKQLHPVYSTKTQFVIHSVEGGATRGTTALVS
jgi:hypothetical protein